MARVYTGYLPLQYHPKLYLTVQIYSAATQPAEYCLSFKYCSRAEIQSSLGGLEDMVAILEGIVSSVLEVITHHGVALRLVSALGL